MQHPRQNSPRNYKLSNSNKEESQSQRNRSPILRRIP